MSDTGPDGDAATLADYANSVAEKPDEGRWGLLGGGVGMLTNPSFNLGPMFGDILAPLKLSLSAGGCRAFAGELGGRRSADPGDDTVVIPGIVVRCGPRRDRGPEFDFCRDLASLRHVALAGLHQMRVERRRRSSDGWTLHVLSGPSGRPAFDALGFTVKLDTIDLDVPVMRPVGASGMGGAEPPTLIPRR